MQGLGTMTTCLPYSWPTMILMVELELQHFTIRLVAQGFRASCLQERTTHPWATTTMTCGITMSVVTMSVPFVSQLVTLSSSMNMPTLEDSNARSKALQMMSACFTARKLAIWLREHHQLS